MDRLDHLGEDQPSARWLEWKAAHPEAWAADTERNPGWRTGQSTSRRWLTPSSWSDPRISMTALASMFSAGPRPPFTIAA